MTPHHPHDSPKSLFLQQPVDGRESPRVPVDERDSAGVRSVAAFRDQQLTGRNAVAYNGAGIGSEPTVTAAPLLCQW